MKLTINLDRRFWAQLGEAGTAKWSHARVVVQGPPLGEPLASQGGVSSEGGSAQTGVSLGGSGLEPDHVKVFGRCSAFTLSQSILATLGR